MAANRAQTHALDKSARWLGGGAVALLHLLMLLAFLAADRLTQRQLPEQPPPILYRVPQTPKAAPAGGNSGHLAVPLLLKAPDLPVPAIELRPDPPAVLLPQGLDLQIHPGATKTLDDLAPPSREQALKKFFLESAAEGRQARELSAGKDCVPVFARDRDAALLPTSPIKDMIPIEDKCSPRESAASLGRRNDRFSPK